MNRVAGCKANRLSVSHRRWIYLACALVYASGLLWLGAHYALASPSDAMSARRPLESWSLWLHGAAAMGFLAALGSLFPAHITQGWEARSNFASGVTMLAMAAVLIASGWGLYYLGAETVRDALSIAHWALGVAAGPLLLLHIVLGRRDKQSA